MANILRKNMHGIERPLEILWLMLRFVSEECLLDELWGEFSN